MAKGETGSDLAARQLPLWSAAIFSIFLSSLCLCFCFWLSFFRSFPVVFYYFFFSNFPRYLCKFFARRCVDDATSKERGRWFRVYVSEIKISLSANCRPGLTFPARCFMAYLSFFFFSVSVAVCTVFFYSKRFSVCRKFFMV